MVVPVLDKKMIVALILFGGAYLVCCWAVVSGWHSEYREFELRKAGITIEATVTASYSRSRMVPAELKYEFKHDGRTFTGSEFVSMATKQSYVPGMAIQVRFLPHRPQFNRLTEPPSHSFRHAFLVGLCLMTLFVLSVGIAVVWVIGTGRRIFKPGAFWTTSRKMAV